MPPLNSNDLNRIFKSLDRNGDGVLSIEELNWLLQRTGVDARQEELLSLVGEPGLDFENFCTFYETLLHCNKKKKGTKNASLNGYVHEKQKEEEEDCESDLYKAFKVFDLDGDGLISPEELQSVLWRLGMWDNNGGVDCDRIIHKFDVNSDGFVDFEEFKRMMLANYTT